MTRSKSILGLLFLSALCFCAFGASSASAVTMHECKKAPVSGETTQQYTTSECTTKGTGEFRTVPIPLKETVELTPTATETFVLHTTIGGIETTIACKALTGSGKATNEEPKAGVMQVSGKEIRLKFSECSLTKPVEATEKGCTVTVAETSEATSITSEMSTTYTPVNAEKLFTTITIANCKAPLTILNGAKKVTGTAKGVNQEATPQTTEFTETSGGELKVAGQAALLTGKAHAVTKGTTTIVSLETP